MVDARVPKRTLVKLTIGGKLTYRCGTSSAIRPRASRNGAGFSCPNGDIVPISQIFTTCGFSFLMGERRLGERKRGDDELSTL